MFKVTFENTEVHTSNTFEDILYKGYNPFKAVQEYILNKNNFKNVRFYL